MPFHSTQVTINVLILNYQSFVLSIFQVLLRSCSNYHCLSHLIDTSSPESHLSISFAIFALSLTSYPSRDTKSISTLQIVRRVHKELPSVSFVVVLFCNFKVGRIHQRSYLDVGHFLVDRYLI